MTVQEKNREAPLTSLELLYHISRELASALDLSTLLQRVLFLAIENVGAVNGSLIVLDDSGQVMDAAIVVDRRLIDDAASQLDIIYRQGLAGWVARSRQAVLIPDTSKDERWLFRPDDSKTKTGPKSAVSAPITARDQLVGVLTLVHPEPGFFDQSHLSLAQAIADQAGIAILNARLYAESQRQARIMTALAESAAAITSSLDLEVVLQRILEQISQALRVEAVSLALLTPQGQELEYAASIPMEERNMLGLRFPVSQGIAGWVARHGQGLVVPNAQEDPLFDPEADRLTGFKTRAVVCAPIRSNDEVIGIVEALNPVDNNFGADALTVLTGIGSLAGSAIRHAQLFERLQAAHKRYHDLFDDNIDPILITVWDGRIMELNHQAEITIQQPAEELRHRQIRDLQVVSEEHLGEKFEKLYSGETLSYQSTLHTPGGSEIPVQVYVRSVEIDSDFHLQWILRDISERKKLDSLRDDLISMIYHDLRSPLGNVVSSLDVLDSLLYKEDDKQDLKPLLDIAIRSTDRIQRLTNSLLDMNRLEAGQELGNRHPDDLSKIIADSLDAVSPIAKNKQVEIVLDVSPGLPQVEVDGDMIRRVLINLLENAIRYTPEASKIYVGARLQDGFIRTWVQDSGPGIPPEDQERIFDKFTRLNGEQGPRGFGLGLAFCRLAVHAHGGEIGVENVPGSGASFHFTLPVMPAADC